MEKLPFKLLGDKVVDLSIFNYDLTQVMNRSKVVLDQYVISFLIQGHKQISFADSTILVDNSKALLISKGNYLVTEKGYGSEDYKSILIFFSKSRLNDLLLKKQLFAHHLDKDIPVPAYFPVEQDDFVKTFVSSLMLHFKLNRNLSRELLEIKFEEIMLYLIDTYGEPLIAFLLNTIENERELIFKKTIEANKYSNLSLSDLAFLCNMSISTFKRHFTEIFNDTPAKWFKQHRLEMAKIQLTNGDATPSELFMRSGYKNLSHFCTAYKLQFGNSPRYNAIKD
ncbi:helix-turn-helix domain-containing protein [Mucilaginibacter sp.]